MELPLNYITSSLHQLDVLPQMQHVNYFYVLFPFLLENILFKELLNHTTALLSQHSHHADVTMACRAALSRVSPVSKPKMPGNKTTG